MNNLPHQVIIQQPGENFFGSKNISLNELQNTYAQNYNTKCSIIQFWVFTPIWKFSIQNLMNSILKQKVMILRLFDFIFYIILNSQGSKLKNCWANKPQNWYFNTRSKRMIKQEIKRDIIILTCLMHSLSLVTKPQDIVWHTPQPLPHF